MCSHLMVIGDSSQQVTIYAKALEAALYEVDVVVAPENLPSAVRTAHPELILLVLPLGGMDNQRVCRRVAEISRAGLVVVGESDDEAAIVEALDAGADSYLTRADTAEEVVAHVMAVRRRLQRAAAADLGESHR